MLDLIKTFFLGIWVEKKFRYLFLFLIICSFYRFIKWFSVLIIYTMAPVSFSQVNDDGSLSFVFLKKFDQKIYPKNYQMPTKNGHKNKNYDIKDVINTKKCEQDFFKQYKNAVEYIIKSSVDNKFIIYFDEKFPTKIGEIGYYDSADVEQFVYEKLYKQGFIFDKKKDINYCEEYKKILKI